MTSTATTVDTPTGIPNILWRRWRQIIFGLLVFVITSSVSLYSLKRNNPLFLFLAEEYVELGWNYYQYGNFYGDLPVKAVFRPPGYSLFCAAVFFISDGNPGKNIPFTEMAKNIPLREKVFTDLERSQALLLGLSALLVFIITNRYLDATKASVLALLFGCNPYTVILTGLYHYDIVHIFVTLLATWLLSVATTRQHGQTAWLVVSGIAWGFATLVRPITLILPCFILMLFLFDNKKMWRKAFLKTALFSVGMLLIIAPWTIRNYNLTQRLIPVNAQTGIAFWAATSKVNEFHPNHYGWMNIWYPDGDTIFKRITGYSYNNNAQYAIFSIQMEDEFKRIVLSNLTTHPSIYVRNIISNMALFTFNMNDVLIKVFEAFQKKNIPPEVWTEWITPGNPQNFYSSQNQHSFYYFIIALTLMSLAGIILAVKQHAVHMIAIAAVFLCIGTAYSISYLDLMYYSIKMPFLFLMTGYFLSCISGKKFSTPVFFVKEISMATIPLTVLGAWVSWMSYSVLFTS